MGDVRATSENRQNSSLLRSLNTLAYQFLMCSVSALPRKAAYRIARYIGRLRFDRLQPRLQPQVENMALRLPASRDHAASLLQRSFELAACEDLESWLYSRMTKERIHELIEIRGLENLESALRSGKGAILYSGHFRGHLTFFAALGLLGYKPNLLSEPLGPQLGPIERWFHQRVFNLLEQKLGCRFLFAYPNRFGVAAEAAHALKRNEVVTVAIDHTFSRKNVTLPWMRDRARFPYGPVLLAQTSGAPLLSFFLHRTDEWVPQVAEIGAPFYPSEDLVSSVRHCASALEEKILQHPANWATWLFPKPHLWEAQE